MADVGWRELKERASPWGPIVARARGRMVDTKRLWLQRRSPSVDCRTGRSVKEMSNNMEEKLWQLSRDARSAGEVCCSRK